MFNPYQPIDPDNLPESTTAPVIPEGGWNRTESTPPVQPSTYPTWSVRPQADPTPPAAPKKRRSRRGLAAGAVAACMVFSAVCGFGGGYLASRLNTPASTSGGTTTNQPVLYQSVASTGSTGELSVADVAAKAADSVVEINTKSITNSFYGQQVSGSAGSGVILSADGYIVTNNHVIENASSITVRTRSGDEYEASLIGADAQSDLAVLKIDARGLTPAVLGDSDSLVVGETAVAIGNPLGELGGTVTSGIISALSREITMSDGVTMTLLQTNAAINPGNSGGGLFNSDGELIGVVNAKSTGEGVEGLGFAIPVNTMKSVVEDLISQGYVSGRVDAGFTVIDLTSQEQALLYGVRQTGIYVYRVTDSSSGMQSGDRILSINGTEIATLNDYNTVLQEYSAGDTLTFVVARSNRQITVLVTLQEDTGDTVSSYENNQYASMAR